jgi:hypothetical protein
MSNPTMRLSFATFASSPSTPCQSIPPGSGVPTAGMTDGSKASRSMDT